MSLIEIISMCLGIGLTFFIFIVGMFYVVYLMFDKEE